MNEIIEGFPLSEKLNINDGRYSGPIAQSQCPCILATWSDPNGTENGGVNKPNSRPTTMYLKPA